PYNSVGAGGGAPAAPATPSPTLLYGYGGFNVSLQPSFNAMRLAWLDDVGGVYALAWYVLPPCDSRRPRVLMRLRVRELVASRPARGAVCVQHSRRRRVR
ncbi:MAG: hypothetical protein EOO65_06190, partial [Methanosarcinales archaeon]